MPAETGFKRRRAVLAVVACAVIVFAIFRIAGMSGGDTHADMSDLVDKVHRVTCRACNQTYDLPAAEHERLMQEVGRGDAGFKCIQCGQMKAWYAGVALPSEGADHEFVAQFPTMPELEQAMRDLTEEAQRLEAGLADSAAADGQPEELRRKLSTARTRLRLLNEKWDELAGNVTRD